jgi:hypothetical protein
MAIKKISGPGNPPKKKTLKCPPGQIQVVDPITGEIFCKKPNLNASFPPGRKYIGGQKTFKKGGTTKTKKK